MFASVNNALGHLNCVDFDVCITYVKLDDDENDDDWWLFNLL